MKAFVLGGLLVTFFTSSFAQAGALEDRVTALEAEVATLKQKVQSPTKSAVVPAKTNTYRFAAACADIVALNLTMKQTFQIQVLKEVECGNVTYVYARVYAPGYTPDSSLEVFRKADVVFFPK